MKRFFKFIPILLILCFSTVFAENYVHYEWTCVQKDGSNVAQSDTITENKTYTTAKFYSNGGNGLPTNCIGAQTKNTYTVALNGNGGTVSGGLSYQSDGSFKLPTNVTKTGYTFTGWTGSNGTTAQTDVTVSATTSGNLTYTANWSINSYYLDLNGWLDGASVTNISGFGTADVYINGELKASGVTDFYQKINYGSTYEIKNIKANAGRTYNGVHSGSLSGTIPAGNVGVSLDFTRNTYYVDVNRYINGEKYGTASGLTDFTFNVYINNALIAENVTDWCTADNNYKVYYGDVVKVVPTSHIDETYDYATPSTTVTGETEVNVSWNYRPYLDLNYYIDGTKMWTGQSGFTVNIYENNNLIAQNVQDYGGRVAYGATVRVEATSHTSDYTYNRWEAKVYSDTSLEPSWTSNWKTTTTTIKRSAYKNDGGWNEGSCSNTGWISLDKNIRNASGNLWLETKDTSASSSNLKVRFSDGSEARIASVSMGYHGASEYATTSGNFNSCGSYCNKEITAYKLEVCHNKFSGYSNAVVKFTSYEQKN